MDDMDQPNFRDMLSLMEMEWDSPHTNPSSLYNSYRERIVENLKPAGTVLQWRNNETLTEQETVSPTFEDHILLTVLYMIDRRLPTRVREVFGPLLGNNTFLMDMKMDILNQVEEFLLMFGNEECENEDEDKMGRSKNNPVFKKDSFTGRNIEPVKKEKGIDLYIKEELIFEEFFPGDVLEVKSDHSGSNAAADQTEDLSSLVLDSDTTDLPPLKREIQCTICGKEFPRPIRLIQHMKRKHPTKKLSKCNFCGKEFCSPSALDKHLPIHTDDKRFKCGTCGRGFAKPVHYEAHLRIHTGEKPFKCEYCGKRFTTSFYCRKHSKIHTGEDPYVCTVCGQTFPVADSLEEHLKMHSGWAVKSDPQIDIKDETKEHFKKEELLDKDQGGVFGALDGFANTNTSNNLTISDMDVLDDCDNEHAQDKLKLLPGSQSGGQPPTTKLHHRVSRVEPRSVSRIQCSICGEEFSQAVKLRQHLRRQHPGENLFKCSVCGKEFCSPSLLNKHVLRYHTAEKPFKCKICGKSFSEAYNYRVHFRTHSGEKPYKCEYCGKEFTQKGHHKIHVRIHTGEKPCMCSICGKGFTTTDMLNKHIRTHTGEKPYKCDMCEKSFSQPGSLRWHLRMHRGEQDRTLKLVCSDCGKEFSTSQSFKQHVRTHTGEKPYKCSVCEKAFAQASSLSSHLRMHRGEKPYNCTVCGKDFCQSGHLKIHMKLHSSEKPYSCEICQKSFKLSGYLKDHMKIHNK